MKRFTRSIPIDRLHRRRVSRQGFTLLEMAIASVLIAVLMAGVWNVLSLYEGVFKQGESRTEQVQLLRTLAQQLSDDLAGAIQDPVFVDPRSRGPTGARRFGLFGTAGELRIDVLQIPAFDIAPTPTAVELEDRTSPRKLQAPELRTVYYSFEGAVADAALPGSRVGLTRRELDFETPEELDDSLTPGLANVAPDVESPGQAEAAAPLSAFDALSEAAGESSLMWAPEVVALQFRYFDGSAWQSEWDGLARQGLPVAVEMTLAVASLDDAEKIRGAAAVIVEEGGLAAPPGAEVDLSAQRRLPQPRVHRVVIRLANSPHLKPPAEIRQRAAPTLAAPKPLPQLILAPAPSGKRAEPLRPDQWMRNE